MVNILYYNISENVHFCVQENEYSEVVNVRPQTLTVKLVSCKQN